MSLAELTTQLDALISARDASTEVSEFNTLKVSTGDPSLIITKLSELKHSIHTMFGSEIDKIRLCIIECNKSPESIAEENAVHAARLERIISSFTID